MGGQGSGRPVNYVKRLAEQKTSFITHGQEDIFIPNYSGVSREFLKTENNLIFLSSDGTKISFFQNDFDAVVVDVGININYDPTLKVFSSTFDGTIGVDSLQPGYGQFSFGANNGVPDNIFPFFSAGGTYDSPSDVTEDDRQILGLSTLVYRNGAFRPIASMNVNLVGTPSDTNLESEIVFRTAKNNEINASTDILVIRGTGIFIEGDVSLENGSGTFKSSDGSSGLTTTFEISGGSVVTVKDGIITNIA